MTYFPNKNFQDSNNTSTTPLGIGALFTGTWTDVSNYSSISVACLTDQNADLFLEFSNNGTTVQSILSYKVAANLNEVHKLVVTRKYFRVRLVNTSVSAQTSLDLSTLVGDFDTLSAPLNLRVGQDGDALIVRPTEFRYEVAQGRFADNNTWNKFGYNLDIDAVASEVIASFGGTFTPLTTAEILNVASTSVNDTSAGTGARTIEITGIGSNGMTLKETITLNGTTNVPTVNTFLGVNRVKVTSAGTSKTNEGTITLTAVTSNTIQGQIPFDNVLNKGDGITKQCIFHVHENHTFFIDWLDIQILRTSGGGAPLVTVSAFVFDRDNEVEYSIFRTSIDTAITNDLQFNLSQPFSIPSNSVLYFIANTNENNTEVNLRFSGIELKN